MPDEKGDVFLYHERLWVLERNCCGHPRLRDLGSLEDAANALPPFAAGVA